MKNMKRTFNFHAHSLICKKNCRRLSITSWSRDRTDQARFKGPRGIIAFNMGKRHVFNTPNANDNIYRAV